VIENHIYDGYKKDIEENVMVLAKICRKEFVIKILCTSLYWKSCNLITFVTEKGIQ
jgi:hypothetical protein